MSISGPLGHTDPPVLNIDPFSDSALLDPYPGFDEMREAAPVVRLAPYALYAITRHDIARSVIADYASFTSCGGIGMSDIRKPGAWRSPSPISEIDPPDHTSVRAVLTRILSPLVIRRWRETFQRHADEVAERAAEGREVDGVRDIAEAFVLSAFPEVLGIDVPPESFVAIGEMNFNQLGPNNHRVQRSIERVAPIMSWYQDSFARDSMRPGGFAAQIFEAEDAGEFASGTAPAHVRSFLRAGVDTTIAGLGSTLDLLARHPDQWARVKADPSLARRAFEEALRLESPSQVLFRTTVGKQSIEGFRLEPDTKVGVFFGAANRDVRRWPDADRFDVGRDSAGQHLAFGAGAHVCIGQMIARLEAECILTAIISRTRSLEPTGPSRYRLVNTLRTLDVLPLRLTPS